MKRSTKSFKRRAFECSYIPPQRIHNLEGDVQIADSESQLILIPSSRIQLAGSKVWIFSFIITRFVRPAFISLSKALCSLRQKLLLLFSLSACHFLVHVYRKTFSTHRIRRRADWIFWKDVGAKMAGNDSARTLIAASSTRFMQMRLFMLALIFLLSNAQGPAKPSKEGSPELMILAESDFLWDDDNWTVRGNASDFQHSNRMVKAADDGPDEWYFVAPGKFLGAKRAAYGGTLSFKHGLFEYNRFVSCFRCIFRSSVTVCLR